MTQAPSASGANFSAASRAGVLNRKPLNTMWRVLEDWPTRALFGLLLAGVALAATLAGGYWFVGFIALCAAAAAREWHRMRDGRVHALERWITCLSIAAALAVLAATPHVLWPFPILGAGAFLAAGTGFRNGGSAVWHGIATLYIGIPAVCLAALRLGAPHGAWTIVGLFVVIWCTDTGALFIGRLIGGPKLLPSLSPNKTWAGSVGGIVVPAAAFALYVSATGGRGAPAALLGLCLALAAQAGDLFESWMKRIAGRKNSGSLIPGHGGVLDRIDSTLFVAPLAAVLVFVFGVDILFGAHT